MTRVTAAIALALATMLGPIGAFADDLTPPDGHAGEDCMSEPATSVNDPANPNDDNLPRQEDYMGAGPGRYSLCVSDGNKTNRNELYVGGDFTRLTNGDPNRQCMHIEVAGQVVWRRPGYPAGNPDRFCH